MTVGRMGLVFPGQGVQSVGMGQSLAQHYPEARRTFEEADDALGFGLSKMMWRGTAMELESTEIQQPAILTVSIAAWRALQTRCDFGPVVALGLSLGEYSAYVAAEALEFPDAVRITRIRGRAMQQAVPMGKGGMLAVSGLDADTVLALCGEAATAGVVEPANYNAPGQIVCAGEVAALERLEELVAATPKARAIRLPVSAPFHCSLLRPAAQTLQDVLGSTLVRAPKFPVIANVDSHVCTVAADIVPRLVDQVAMPVRFEQGVRAAVSLFQPAGFLELGPGKTLAALIRKIDRGVPVASIGDPEGLDRALESLLTGSYN